MKNRSRIDVSGTESSLSNNPFTGLDVGSLDLPDQPVQQNAQPSTTREEKKGPGSRGRVDVIRQKAGRGGKTVTVLSGFRGVSPHEFERFARDLRKACGVGGTVKGSQIEIQGDQCERASEYLVAAGFRPVRAGG
jgi:translation initiation factor 1